MAITDLDQVWVTSLVLRDVLATVGSGHEEAIVAFAANARRFEEDLGRYTARVVEDVQQYIHDCFIDTTWPRCPHHPNHPMSFQGGRWYADGVAVAELGELGSLLKQNAG